MVWEKGAILWLRQALGLDRTQVVTVYMGDDVTDEDAFRVILNRGFGLGIMVTSSASGTQTPYYPRDCDELQRSVGRLLEVLESATSRF